MSHASPSSAQSASKHPRNSTARTNGVTQGFIGILQVTLHIALMWFCISVGRTVRYNIRLQMMIAAFRAVKENGWFVLSVLARRDYRGELLHMRLTVVELSLFLHLSPHVFIDRAEDWTFVHTPMCMCLVHCIPSDLPACKTPLFTSLQPLAGPWAGLPPSRHLTLQPLQGSSRSLGGQQAASTVCYCHHGSSSGNICEVLHKPEISIRFTSKQV